MAARFGDVLYWAFSGLAFLVIAFVVWGYGRPVTRRGDGWRRVVFISCFQPRCVAVAFGACLPLCFVRAV